MRVHGISLFINVKYHKYSQIKSDPDGNDF